MSATASSRGKSTQAKTVTKKPRAKAAVKPKKSAKSVKKTVAPAKPVEVTAQTPDTEALSPQTQAPKPEVTDEQVSQRAYDIWIEKGRPYGQEQANWDQAVAELRG